VSDNWLANLVPALLLLGMLAALYRLGSGT
jgi:hypothetical protein